MPALRVLESVERPTSVTNPYITQLFDGLRAEGLTVDWFDWRTAFRGRYDVFHVHWPDSLFRAGSAAKRTAKTGAFLALLIALRARSIPIVWTVHNIDPHEGGALLQRAAYSLFLRSVSAFVLINHAGVPDTVRRARGRTGKGRVETILHGHYRDWFERFPASGPVAGRLLYFGLLRPYKGVEALIEAFGQVARPEASLHVVGKPIPASYGDELALLAERDPRIRLTLEFADDATLAREIHESGLVVLPYRQMYNSGSALLALSLDRPVLVPRSPANAALSSEVGEGWVLSFDSALTGPNIERAMDAAGHRTGAATADLSARDWSRGIAAHIALFERLASTRHRR
jgi:beta-1,4-mannosyltransferase